MRSPNVPRGLVCRVTLFFLFVVLATSTSAQQTVTSAALSGRAHDASGAIVIGARITGQEYREESELDDRHR